jgi:hypothetical protein
VSFGHRIRPEYPSGEAHPLFEIPPPGAAGGYICFLFRQKQFAPFCINQGDTADAGMKPLAATCSLSEGQSPDSLVDKTVLAKHFGVCERTVDDWTARRKVPFFRLSRRMIRFRIADVERALDRYRVQEIH